MVAYAGTSRKVSRTEATITGLDNNTKYQFKVYAVNDIGRGPVRTSRSMQSQGPVGIPEAPTVEDTPTSPSTATLTVTWPPVPPNGPGPVQYRVLRNGQPVPGCETLQQTLCTIPGVTYNGALNEFKVGSSIGRDLPSFGPGKQWYAVGKPDVVGRLDGGARRAPTREARVTFTVPQSRGTESTVALLVDGAVVREYDATGSPGPARSTCGDNDRAHTVALRVCNEFGRCSQSEAKPVQAYGPLRSEHILDVHAEQSGSQVRWLATVDTNGNGAAVQFAERAAQPVGRRARASTSRPSRRDVAGHRLRRHRVDRRHARRRRSRPAGRCTGSPRPRRPRRRRRRSRCRRSRAATTPAAGMPACGGNGADHCVEATCASAAS